MPVLGGVVAAFGVALVLFALATWQGPITVPPARYTVPYVYVAPSPTPPRRMFEPLGTPKRPETRINYVRLECLVLRGDRIVNYCAIPYGPSGHAN